MIHLPLITLMFAMFVPQRGYKSTDGSYVRIPNACKRNPTLGHTSRPHDGMGSCRSLITTPGRVRIMKD